MKKKLQPSENIFQAAQIESSEEEPEEEVKKEEKNTFECMLFQCLITIEFYKKRKRSILKSNNSPKRS